MLWESFQKSRANRKYLLYVTLVVGKMKIQQLVKPTLFEL